MKKLKGQLIKIAKISISNKDPSHDINHALRVLKNSEYIASVEGGDLEIIIPAALFHDIINFRKDNPKSRYAPIYSAKLAEKILHTIPEYNEQKITRVKQAITEHSYTDGIKPTLLESKILQDADRLEATGTIAIMRTFSSTGQMQRQFYNPKDPFCKKRKPQSHKYALDLFYNRLLKVKTLMNTKTAKKLAEKRTKFLHKFLKELHKEITIGKI